PPSSTLFPYSTLFRSDEEFSLGRLAREAGVSEFHFCRLFKKTTGFAPSRYFIRMRMEKARRLLRETTKSVIEVGLDVGYSSPSQDRKSTRLNSSHEWI